jgi:hypothetical protein
MPDLFLDSQNQFLTKETLVRLMSSSITSTSSRSVSCMVRYRFHPNQFKLLLPSDNNGMSSLSESSEGERVRGEW